ncbi:MAG: hypothetical protein JXQ73_02280 [Phycisphaerae bacterium]|nr:hypothetical protein [Phycisphaerae bacterium]
MLSIVDLIDAETVTIELAAYLLAAIGQGASFMVGALPGGAGKTTVMGALLNFVPPDVELAPAESEGVVRDALDNTARRRCLICHEIGAGFYYAYLWGGVLADLLLLPAHGHMVATNLHADTIDQARCQLCVDNPVPVETFDRFGLMLFLDVSGRWPRTQRRIATVYEPDASGPPRLVYHMNTDGAIKPAEPSSLVDGQALGREIERIESLRATGARTVEQVRRLLVGA